MSASNTRIKDYGTIHHIVSRIAHRVYFLGDDERNDLLEMIRRAADFSGIQLLGWCVMTNHFHILAHLPNPVELDESELLRRYELLKGKSGRIAAEQRLAKWRAGNEWQRADDWLASVRRRMYDIGSFMKIVKQWFTEEYNRRQKHVGTLWESVYHDKVVPGRMKDMSRVLGYIHLNPIRAAAADCFDGYLWSSFSALSRGDEVALAGMRFVYDSEDADAQTLITGHKALLNELLESFKRQRAEEICRKRAAGYDLPADQLTNEAMVAQIEAQRGEIQNVLASLHADREIADRVAKRRRDVSDEVFLAALRMDPTASVSTIAELLSISCSCVYGKLRRLESENIIRRIGRGRPWEIV